MVSPTAFHDDGWRIQSLYIIMHDFDFSVVNLDISEKAAKDYETVSNFTQCNVTLYVYA